MEAIAGGEETDEAERAVVGEMAKATRGTKRGAAAQEVGVMEPWKAWEPGRVALGGLGRVVVG